jgi:hypothetical protein
MPQQQVFTCFSIGNERAVAAVLLDIFRINFASLKTFLKSYLRLFSGKNCIN